MLEDLREAGLVRAWQLRLAVGAATQHRYQEAQQHPGHRGVHPGSVHERPGDGAYRQQNHPGRRGVLAEIFGVPLRQEAEQAEGKQHPQQVGDLDVGRIEERDDRNGDQIVHHGEGQQEDAQRAGQVRADHG